MKNTPEANHLLSVLAEECAEIIQRVTKAQRFGLLEVQPGHSLTNAERIASECDDWIGTMQLLREREIVPPLSAARAEDKVAKVLKFMEYAREIGAL